MLVLTFQIGNDRFGLEIRRIREVVPRVNLTRAAGSHNWLAGLFVYRGLVVPVVDLHRLLGAGECPPHLASRIILVPLQQPSGAEVLIGLLAAQVADIREFNPGQVTLPGFGAPGGPEIGVTFVEGGRILHLVDLDRLLSEPMRSLLPAP